MPKKEFHRLRRQLGMSQNAVARAIGREQGYFGRVLRKETPSAPVWREVRRFFRKAGVLKDGDAT